MNIKSAARIFALGLLLSSFKAAWARPVTFTQVVVPVTPTETLTITPTTVNAGTPVQFVARVSGVQASPPTGTVKFAVLGPASPSGSAQTAIATSNAIPVVSGQTSWTSTPPVGAYTVTASYSGDVNYNPTSATASGTVLATDFDFTVPNATVTQGQNVTENISVTPINGFTGTVTFSCVPSGNFGCTLPTSSYTVGNTTPASVMITAYPGQFVAASSLFLLFLGFSARRRRFSAVLPIMIAGIGLLSLSGCGGGSNAGWQAITNKGTYQATIVGTSGTIQHSKIITITVQ